MTTPTTLVLLPDGGDVLPLDLPGMSAWYARVAPAHPAARPPAITYRLYRPPGLLARAGRRVR